MLCYSRNSRSFSCLSLLRYLTLPRPASRGSLVSVLLTFFMSELPLDPESYPGTQDYEDWRDQRRRRNRSRTHEDYDQFEDYPDDSI